uniref:Uncharacterized protein n=1 Tax=Rhizochromulina marina TaxID=1034831 RepID=A0A7S2RVA6_9STRA|mmetsp:Transcript_21582/g.62859  ORF Transcript_21582/g.62859 Transcript_21582/m.62859 type:complete len:544 (+) Transcript_21582:343-1974(+)
MASPFQLDDLPFPAPVPGLAEPEPRGGLMSRTPPTSTPSSYGRFIPKRGRTGSIGTGAVPRHQSGEKALSTSSSKLSTSLSGRLRSVSDLERSGFVSAAEKGRLKDLIINGDEALRAALDKYETGDSTELEGLISKGYLGRDGIVDVAELDSLDLGSLGLVEGNEFMSMMDGAAGSADGQTWDFNFDAIPGTGGVEFQMDDLGLPFGGMDELMPQPHGRGIPVTLGPVAVGGGAEAGGLALGGGLPPPGAVSLGAGNGAASAGGLGLPGGPVGGTSSAHAPATARAQYFSSASQQPPLAAMALGLAPVTSSASSKRSAAPSISGASGTTVFPNSSNSGSKFPVSNCVAELPPLDHLPQGPAPAYEQLINFQRAKSKDSIRCVMCGKPPSTPVDGEGGTVIPQQNKDVCRDCDKALWVHGESATYFKWCKGCKRFRNIVAFSEKLDASKCNSCRERGRRSYLQRKGANSGAAAGAAAPALAAPMAPVCATSAGMVTPAQPAGVPLGTLGASSVAAPGFQAGDRTSVLSPGLSGPLAPLDPTATG